MTGFLSAFLFMACGQTSGPFIGDMLPLTVQPGSSSRIQIPLDVPEGDRVRKATFSTKNDVLPEQQISVKTLNLVVPPQVSGTNSQVTGIITVEDSKGSVTRKEFLITILKNSSSSKEELVEVSN